MKRFNDVKRVMQEALYDSEDDYCLKTDEELLSNISYFGCGECDFHTADVERLIMEKRALLEILNGISL